MRQVSFQTYRLDIAFQCYDPERIRRKLAYIWQKLQASDRYRGLGSLVLVRQMGQLCGHG